MQDEDIQVGDITDEKVDRYVNKVLSCWDPKGINDLWWRCQEKVNSESVYKNFRAAERQVLWLVLKELTNGGGQTTGRNVVQAIDKRMNLYKKHIRRILENSKADYDDIWDGDLLTEDDVALQQALRHEDYHNVFTGTPASTLTKKQVEQFYKDAGEKVNRMIDKYRIHGLESMHVAPETMDKLIQDNVPNREMYEQARKAKSVAEFLAEVQAKETDEYLQKLIDDFISTYTISFENLSNNARRKLQPMLQKAITTILHSITDTQVAVFVRGYSNGQWRTAKQMNCEEFDAWMNIMFVRPEGGFLIDYTDSKHYALTDGDRRHTPPAFVFEKLAIVIGRGKHKC